ncbi:MAG: DUF433 domain-containing protein [Chloroflexi bacterium]|nr:DUF433 domain-containing protein [Chloroflexota bacterium]MCI0646257.1 DUF433 domain-containing protein [Chloroflexota bacterium]
MADPMKYSSILQVPGVCGGRPIIAGTRMSVKAIVGWTRLGLTPEEIIDEYPQLSAAQVADALAYYTDHPEEIEAEFAEEKRYLKIEFPRLQAMIAAQRQQQD